MNHTRNTQTSIHGHEIIHLIHDAAVPFTRTTLEAEVRLRFGPEVRFHTCCAEAMTLEQLLQFLIFRGKVVEREGRLHAVMARVCSDED